MPSQPAASPAAVRGIQKATYLLAGLAALAIPAAVGVVALTEGSTREDSPPLVSPPKASPSESLPAAVAAPAVDMELLAVRIQSGLPGASNAKQLDSPGYARTWKEIGGQRAGMSITLMRTMVGVYAYVPKSEVESAVESQQENDEISSLARALAVISGEDSAAPEVEADLRERILSTVHGRSLTEATPPLQVGTFTINGMTWKVGSLKLQDQWARESPENGWKLGLCGIVAEHSPATVR